MRLLESAWGASYISLHVYLAVATPRGRIGEQSSVAARSVEIGDAKQMVVNFSK